MTATVVVDLLFSHCKYQKEQIFCSMLTEENIVKVWAKCLALPILPSYLKSSLQDGSHWKLALFFYEQNQNTVMDCSYIVNE